MFRTLGDVLNRVPRAKRSLSDTGTEGSAHHESRDRCRQRLVLHFCRLRKVTRPDDASLVGAIHTQKAAHDIVNKSKMRDPKVIVVPLTAPMKTPLVSITVLESYSARNVMLRTAELASRPVPVTW
jgi:hypothetical protein